VSGVVERLKKGWHPAGGEVAIVGGVDLNAKRIVNSGSYTRVRTSDPTTSRKKDEAKQVWVCNLCEITSNVVLAILMDV
jgi:hypothetical protein